MAYSAKLTSVLEKLIADGERLIANAVPSASAGGANHIEDRNGLLDWANRLTLFKSMAGELAQPWWGELHHDGRKPSVYLLDGPLAALRTIDAAIKEGLLTRFEDLIIADAFADLSQQAQYLLSEGYYLAAGVILRAVLEEKLRNLCKRHSCVPSKKQPTINDFNQALYTNSRNSPPVYDKVMMLHVTAMSAVGNHAAHNDPALKKEDVERLARDVPDFLARFSS